MNTVILVLSVVVSLGSMAFAFRQRRALVARKELVLLEHEERMRAMYVDAGMRMRELYDRYGQRAPSKYYDAPYVR